MNKSSTRIGLAAMVLLMTASLAQAGGFSIYEAGAKATGMGCAVTASVDDGSAMFYNIAGISFMPGTVADLNVMPVRPHSKYQQATPPTPSATGETTEPTFLVPGVGVTHRTSGRWGFGVGVYAPFGLGVEWKDPENWVGRFTSYDVYLETIYVTPAVSFQVTPELAVAVGADIAHQSLELNRYSGTAFGGNNEPVNVIKAELEGSSDWNVTPCFGAMYKPAPQWSFGVMYHPKKTMKYDDGTGTLTNVAPEPLRDAVDAQLAFLGGNNYRLTSELGLPSMLSLGVSYAFTERFRAEFNAVHFGWSNFEKLDLSFYPEGSEEPSDDLSSTIYERYEDRWQWRLGFDFDATEKLKLLAGYARDETPQPVESISPLLPDATRNDYSIGAQYATGKWRFTVAWMAVINEARSNVENGQAVMFPEEREDPEEELIKTSEAGAYDTVANVFAFGVGYHF
jgi:long-chain fatty acid transport protein